MLIPPEYASQEPQFLAHIAQGKSVRHFETIRLRKDGTRIHVSVTLSPVKDSAGKVIGVSKVARDITAGKQAEATLRTSETRYRRLFETAKDGVLILDGQTGQITDANPYILEVLGSTHAEVLGRELWEIGVFGDASASHAAMAELQDRGYIRYDDLPLGSKTGQRRQVEVVANAYRVVELGSFRRELDTETYRAWLGSKGEVRCPITEWRAQFMNDAAIGRE